MFKFIVVCKPVFMTNKKKLGVFARNEKLSEQN